MMPPLYLNGRFLTQGITGVQRFATEIVLAMDRLAMAGGMPQMEILMPSASADRPASRQDYRQFVTQPVGRMRGHAWEQMELPVYARGGTLVNLGNSAPIVGGQAQIVVIHDAGVFDTPETYSRRFRLWYKMLWRLLVKVGACIVTVSEFSRRRISDRLGIDPSRIHLVREGGDHMLHRAADISILERHGLQPSQFGLVVGSRVAHKNLGALVELALMLQKRGMVLAIVGAIDQTVFQVGDDRLAGLVRVLGRVNDSELRALYEGANCLLFPTKYEGFGLPAVEAMACDCPVLTSGAGAVQEVCADAALYFDADRPETIVQTVARLLDDPALAATLRARGRERVDIFSWSNAAKDLANIISNARRQTVS